MANDWTLAKIREHHLGKVAYYADEKCQRAQKRHQQMADALERHISDLLDKPQPEPADAVSDEDVHVALERFTALRGESPVKAMRAALESFAKSHGVAPIPMVLHCPSCGVQHIDAPDDRTAGWDNPPHRSHLCHACGNIWRPADVATTGVADTRSHGKNDTQSYDAAGKVKAPDTDARDAARSHLLRTGNTKAK